MENLPSNPWQMKSEPVSSSHSTMALHFIPEFAIRVEPHRICLCKANNSIRIPLARSGVVLYARTLFGKILIMELSHKLFIEKLSGNGPLNFVLIHNAGGDHHFFKHQIPILQKYGDVIWLDLPGHGDSDGILGYTMSDLAHVITQHCLTLNLKNICFVGLNNGANITIEIAASHPLPVHSIILIDPPLFMHKTFISEINEFIKYLDQEEYSLFIDSLVHHLFLETSLENKEIAKRAFIRANKKSLKNIFQGLIEWDKNSQSRLKNISYPVLCILTDEHHCQFRTLSQEALPFTIGKVVGSKCWATLEVPEQVNAMIERFVILNSPV